MEAKTHSIHQIKVLNNHLNIYYFQYLRNMVCNYIEVKIKNPLYRVVKTFTLLIYFCYKLKIYNHNKFPHWFANIFLLTELHVKQLNKRSF